VGHGAVVSADVARSNPHPSLTVPADVSTTVPRSVATPSAAERLTAVLLDAVDEATGDAVRMRRVALALQEIERVRDEDRYGEARAALRRVLARGGVAMDEERVLRVFLGVDDGTVMGRLLGRLPSLTPRASVATGDRR